MDRTVWLPAIALLLGISLGVAGTTLAPQVASPDPADTDQDKATPPAVDGFLEAVLVHTDLRPTAKTSNSTEPHCIQGRTLKTSFRPAMLLNRSESGCGSSERVHLSFYIRSPHRFTLSEIAMAWCHVPVYSMSSVPAGDMLGGIEGATCTPFDLNWLPGHGEARRQAKLEANLFDTAVDQPGLKLGCAAAVIEATDGSHALVQDVTWFEVWDLAEGTPQRSAHLQSKAHNTPCADLEVPFDHGLSMSS